MASSDPGKSPDEGGAWFSRRSVVIWVQIAYLVILLGLGAAYHEIDALRANIPAAFGPIPVGVPWYGALGAVIISISACLEHTGSQWNRALAAWHYSRPFVGAPLGIVAVLMFKASILATGVSPSTGTGNDLLYYVLAFVVGYRESTFRLLVKRIADVLLSPGETTPPT